MQREREEAELGLLELQDHRAPAIMEDLRKRLAKVVGITVTGLT